MFSLTFICEVTGVSYSVWKVLLTLRCLVALLCWQTATKDRMDKNCRDKKRVPCCVSGKQTAMTCEATVYILIKKRGVANSHRNYLWGFDRVLWEEQAPATRGIRERLAYSVRNNRITYRYRLYTSLCLLVAATTFAFCQDRTSRQYRSVNDNHFCQRQTSSRIETLVKDRTSHKLVL